MEMQLKLVRVIAIFLLRYSDCARIVGMKEKSIQLVCKIGSMALINKEYNDIDYNIISRLSRELKPGYILVTSGAVETGKLDYIKRNGTTLNGTDEENKTDYAAQGQSILMQTYRQYIDSRYSVRQLLIEHSNFNDDIKRKHLKEFLTRAPKQNAIPIVNYNDAVSYEENRRHELIDYKKKNDGRAIECIDNDETAAQIACLVECETLVILSTTDGIYKDHLNADTLIEEVSDTNIDRLLAKIEEMRKGCSGSSREGANGAGAKLEYIKDAVKQGIKVIIASSKYSLNDIIDGTVKSTTIFLKK